MKRHGVMVIIRDESGRFLMGKRSSKKTLAPGYWVPISGTVEANETERQTVVRECLEEIGVEVEPLEKIGEMDSSDGTYRLHWWTARIITGTARITTDELSELRWVRKEDLSSLEPTFHEDIDLLLRL